VTYAYQLTVTVQYWVVDLESKELNYYSKLDPWATL